MTREARPALWFGFASIAALAAVVSCSMAVRSCSVGAVAAVHAPEFVSMRERIAESRR